MTVYTNTYIATYMCFLSQWRVVALDQHRAKVHNLIRPRDHYVIQQENVNWFRFWLKDEEDTDPAKAE